VSLDIGYELIRSLVYRSFADRRIESTYTKDAEEWGRLIADLYPKNSRAHAIFAYALTYDGKAELAVPEGLNAVSLNPNDGEANAYLSMANYFSARYNNSVTYGQTAVEVAPESVDAHIAYAKALFITGKYSAAEAEYIKALGINPRLTFPYFELAAFYLSRANAKNAPPDLQQSAVAMYDEVLKLDNKNVKAYTRKCTAYFNQGEVTRALENCRNATTLDPNYTEAWKWQGQVYYNKRGYENAIESFQRCQSQEMAAVKSGALLPEDQYAECWYLQGLAYYLLGKCEKAYPLFNDVLGFTRNEQAINLTRRGIAGCASKDPNYTPPTPIPTPTDLPEPIR
jgi:tetratricopeptide (TPR) repeat protein